MNIKIWGEALSACDQPRSLRKEEGLRASGTREGWYVSVARKDLVS